MLQIDIMSFWQGLHFHTPLPLECKFFKGRDSLYIFIFVSLAFGPVPGIQEVLNKHMLPCLGLDRRHIPSLERTGHKKVVEEAQVQKRRFGAVTVESLTETRTGKHERASYDKDGQVDILLLLIWAYEFIAVKSPSNNSSCHLLCQ